MMRKAFFLAAMLVASTALGNPTTPGGSAPVYIDALSNTPVQIGASGARNLTLLYCINSGASLAYVQVFDATSGNVTLNSTVPNQSYGIPAGQASGLAMGLGSLRFANAITIAATAGSKNATAPASALSCNVGYN